MMKKTIEDEHRGPREYKPRIYESYLSSRQAADGDRAGAERSEDSAFAYYRARLSKWLPDDRSSTIIDLGCGRGNFLKFLREEGYKNIAGIDLSGEQVSLARADLSDVDIREQNLFEFLAEKSGAYDCILALDVIEHLEKESVLEFLDAAYRSLRPGGGLILQTPNAASPLGMEIRYGDFTHDCCFTPGSLRQLLVLAGFGEIVFQEAGPGPRGFISFIRSVLWKVISLCLRFYNLVETGKAGDGVYTRVLQCYARKIKDGART